MATQWFRDSETGKDFRVRNPRCAACLSTDRLLVDHDRWRRIGGIYPRRVLCEACNLKKGNRSYIRFADGSIWKPGMRARRRLPEFRKVHLRAAGHTYEDLRRLAGVTYSMAWKWMNGERVSQPCARAFRVLTGRPG